ncbi:highly acidic protein, partial [Campylobacter peloridis]|nr:highly acidic protein [Campylobacter peloridis]
MKVLLINSNVAVSKLVSLGVQKLGYEFTEMSNLDEEIGFYDIIIVDHEMEVDLENLQTKCERLICLLPRNQEGKEGLECLHKPFLPTDFIELLNGDNVVENLISQNTDITDEEDNKEEDFNEDLLNFDEEKEDELLMDNTPLDGNEL